MARSAAITADDLCRAVQKYGATVRRGSRGGRVIVVAGREVGGVPDGRRRVGDAIVKAIVTAVAAETGSERDEVERALFGRTFVAAKATQSFSPTAKPPARSTRAVTGGASVTDVHSVALEISDLLTAIRNKAKAGRKAPSFYKDAHAALVHAAKPLRSFVQGLTPVNPPIFGRDAYRNPDDSKYRPSRADSVLAGQARAVGETAKAVRRGATITQWQYDERGAK